MVSRRIFQWVPIASHIDQRFILQMAAIFWRSVFRIISLKGVVLKLQEAGNQTFMVWAGPKSNANAFQAPPRTYRRHSLSGADHLLTVWISLGSTHGLSSRQADFSYRHSESFGRSVFIIYPPSFSQFYRCFPKRQPVLDIDLRIFSFIFGDNVNSFLDILVKVR